MKLDNGLKLQLLKEILKQPSAFSFTRENDIMTFLESIWDLRTMSSTDERFNDAYEDIYKHIISNEDWDYEFLFIDRLSLIKDDLIFEKFINSFVSPDFRVDEVDIMNYIYLLEPYLLKAGLSLFLTDYTISGLPIYKVGESSVNDISTTGLKINNIPFFAEFTKDENTNLFDSFEPNIYPSFLLLLNDGWNDYGVVSEFQLFFQPTKNDKIRIGKVKIIHENIKKIYDALDKKFEVLNNEFCSLGQNIDYYRNLKTHLGTNFESVLWALKDAAFFTNINEKFENNENFKDSLIRDDVPERLLREAKFQLYDYDLSNLYSFKYHFKPKFANNKLEVEFNFKNDANSFNRIYAIIGKNGTGKTQLITSLPVDISKKNDDKFTPVTPLFSKVIAVSYSIFDSFEIPKNTASFNYEYCGINDEKGNPISKRGLRLRFHNTRKKIDDIGRSDTWVKILKNFIDEDSINSFITKKDDSEGFLPDFKYDFDLEEFGKVIKMLSSGQSIILYIITEIVAHIRLDSIILYDEPETHLHPNAISQLVNTIYELVHEFESYCIIATHSPLIIRELLSKNVYVIERESQFSSIRNIGIESFGENLSRLTEEVFGNREIPKQYKIILKKMVDKGLSYEKIKELLEHDQIPLSVNTSIFLKSLLNEKS
ncbi:AAA family ATPase [uncultured Nonlabens sp.]|uniref:AbiJ-related protein n=1 Tax=uncultured Nonlabens sp. TaxID=859306 RepID=UPI0030DD7377|tara:strand:- start:13533 stop:15497 length:1965 start_codon:yes stop_codon:yes gene_type:complete